MISLVSLHMKLVKSRHFSTNTTDNAALWAPTLARLGAVHVESPRHSARPLSQGTVLPRARLRQDLLAPLACRYCSAEARPDHSEERGPTVRSTTATRRPRPRPARPRAKGGSRRIGRDGWDASTAQHPHRQKPTKSTRLLVRAGV